MTITLLDPDQRPPAPRLDKDGALSASALTTRLRELADWSQRTAASDWRRAAEHYRVQLAAELRGHVDRRLIDTARRTRAERAGRGPSAPPAKSSAASGRHRPATASIGQPTLRLRPRPRRLLTATHPIPTSVFRPRRQISTAKISRIVISASCRPTRIISMATRMASDAKHRGAGATSSAAAVGGYAPASATNSTSCGRSRLIVRRFQPAVRVR
jgi:hypothetical protein